MLGGGDGGPGRDTIRALNARREANATVYGGPVRDHIRAMTSGYLVGEVDGDGRDTIDAPRLSYDERKAPIRVDLATGRTNEGDRLGVVREVEGGDGGDTLLGSFTSDRGADIIRGRGGPDTIVGKGIDRFHDGRNRLVGAGRATTCSIRSLTTQSRCGAGDDLVYRREAMCLRQIASASRSATTT